MREEIVSRLPASISVAVGAFVIWMAIALPVGILCALKPRSKCDRVITGTTLFFLSAPTYWLALVVLFLFASDIGRFKLIGGQELRPAQPGPEGMVRVARVAVDRPGAGLRRPLRAADRREPPPGDGSGLRADGAREGSRRAADRPSSRLRAALTPVVSLAALDLGLLLGGTVLVETVFNIPASAATRSTRFRTATSRRSRAVLCGHPHRARRARDGHPVRRARPARPVLTVPLLEIRDLSVTFHTSAGIVRAVNGVSLQLDQGRTLGLVGESGSGKTVTALTVLGLTRSEETTVGGRSCSEA